MKYLACLALLTCCAYLPSLAGGYVYEDVNQLPALLQPFHWAQVWAPRGITFLTFRLTNDPLFGHLINLAVHLVNGLLLYTLVRTRLTEGVALLIVAIFWLHPMQVESVAYLTGRGELLACFGLLSAWAAVVFLRGGKRAVAVMLAGLVALGSKEASVVGLLIGLALFTQQWPAWYVWNGVALSFATALPDKFPLADWTWISGQLALAGTYGGRLLWPSFQSVQAPPVDLFAGAAFVALLFAAICWRPTRFAGLWVLLALVPRILLAQPLPIQPEPLHEHHLYVVLPGLCFGLALAAQSLTARKESLCFA